MIQIFLNHLNRKPRMWETRYSWGSIYFFGRYQDALTRREMLAEISPHYRGGKIR